MASADMVSFSGVEGAKDDRQIELSGRDELVAKIRVSIRDKQYKQADDIAESAIMEHGELLAILFEYAMAARVRGDWPAALMRGLRLRELFPQDAAGHLIAGLSLVRMRRFADAESTLSVAISQFHDNPDIAFEYASCVTGDQAKILARWREVNARFPAHPMAMAKLAHAYRQAGDLPSAFNVISEALKQFPDDFEIGIAAAWIASGQERWAESLGIWEKLKARFPNNEAVRTGYGYTLTRAGLAQAELSGPEPLSSHAVLKKPAPDSAILMSGFESLGNNCEFGIVQRHFGAEPLGLLRWTAVAPNELSLALAENLCGIGDPKQTILELRGREYVTRDAKYGMAMHTFIEQQEQTADKLFPKLCRRLSYLKSKLIEDLTEGTKIFVYKDAQIKLGQAQALAAAIQKYGNAELLVVFPDTTGAKVSTVERQGANLLFGYVEHFSTAQLGWNCPFETWLAICTQAKRLSEVHRSPMSCRE
jgi:tetratricopeptide (TPR) repeat protein